MTRAALLLAATLAGAAEAEALDLDCTDANGGTFEIALSSPSSVGPHHCVFAPALRDRAPFCAPDGGWSVSDRGSSVTQFLATERGDWSHDGGWFFARLSPTTFFASASEGTHAPLVLEVDGETFWRLRLDLASRVGIVATAEGEAPFACR